MSLVVAVSLFSFCTAACIVLHAAVSHRVKPAFHWKKPNRKVMRGAATFQIVTRAI